MIARIRWTAVKNHENMCLFPAAIMERFHLSQDKYILHLGQQSWEVYIRPSGKMNPFLYIPPAIFLPALTAEEVMVYENLELNLWVKDGHIYVGPVIGIFTRPNQLKVPKMYSSYMNHMEAGVQKHFLCYYFSFNSIDWDSQRVRGFTFISNMNKWISAWFPLPDVIYDRGAGFTKVQKKSVKEIRKKIRNATNVRFINDRGYFGKWELYQRLANHNEIVQYLPQTLAYKRYETLLSMLEKFDLIFLKSYYGSHGKEVLSIKKAKAGFKLVFNAKGLKELDVRDLKQLKASIDRFIGNKEYILQQGISLLKFKNRLFDLRVLLIKSKDGTWMVMSNYARIAKDGFTITNYSAGGECNFYSKLYPYLCRLYSKLNLPGDEHIAEGALKIASVVELEFGRLGELGLDLAVDMDGRLWLLEVNAKPNKDLVMGIDDFKGVHPQYSAVFDYAGYLCGMED